MPKSIMIDPTEVRKPATLVSPDLPLNAYVPDARREAEKYGTPDARARLPRYGLRARV